MILLQNDGAWREGRPLLAKTCLCPSHCPPCVIQTITCALQQGTFITSFDTQCTLVTNTEEQDRIEKLIIVAAVKKHSTFY